MEIKVNGITTITISSQHHKHFCAMQYMKHLIEVCHVNKSIVASTKLIRITDIQIVIFIYAWQ